LDTKFERDFRRSCLISGVGIGFDEDESSVGLDAEINVMSSVHETRVAASHVSKFVVFICDPERVFIREAEAYWCRWLEITLRATACRRWTSACTPPSSNVPSRLTRSKCG